MTKQNFPSLIERVKAAIADTVVIVFIMVGVTFIFDKFEQVPDMARVIALFSVIGLYDPLFTSVFGGTIGHMLVGIRVKRSNDQDRNIIFPLALLRYACKLLLGTISLLTVTGHDQKKAIHDSVSGSIVIYVKK